MAVTSLTPKNWSVGTRNATDLDTDRNGYDATVARLIPHCRRVRLWALPEVSLSGLFTSAANYRQPAGKSPLFADRYGTTRSDNVPGVDSFITGYNSLWAIYTSWYRRVSQSRSSAWTGTSFASSPLDMHGRFRNRLSRDFFNVSGGQPAGHVHAGHGCQLLVRRLSDARFNWGEKVPTRLTKWNFASGSEFASDDMD